LIVGSGHAGAQTAIGLRNQATFSGSVTIVTEDAELPYERPPLSKDYLSGAKGFDRLLLRPATFWHERHVRILRGLRVVSIDPEAKRAITTDGTALDYDVLVWAAGGRPRALMCEGSSLQGVHCVRTRADIDRIRAELARVERVAVIGGGYIGLEAASVLIKLGRAVALIEMLPRILSRVAGPDISAFFEHTHSAHGVDVRTSTAIEAIEGHQGRVSAVRLAGGESIPAQLVIVGVGIVPNIEPLAAAGAICSNGVHVDEYCRTSLPDTYAIGDCAAHHNRFAGGERIRLESVQNANDQAATAVKALCGQPTPYAAVPWFWSDQYDVKLQTVGLSLGHDTAVTRGDPTSRSFAVAYLKQDRLVALDCVNATRDYVQGRKLVADGVSIDPELLANSATALKDIPQRTRA
jgi:3-phenylpropionate/trans-cinnamate dioxygenase ferredoxin reductase subunit